MLLKTLALATVFATGCATGTAARGTVVMKVDPVDVHVRLGKNEVAAGDNVRLYRKVCTVTPKRYEICRDETVATGTVKEVLDDNYAVAAFPPGTAFAKDARVEKAR
jgi:hypothetical protein